MNSQEERGTKTTLSLFQEQEHAIIFFLLSLFSSSSIVSSPFVFFPVSLLKFKMFSPPLSVSLSVSRFSLGNHYLSISSFLINGLQSCLSIRIIWKMFKKYKPIPMEFLFQQLWFYGRTHVRSTGLLMLWMTASALMLSTVESWRLNIFKKHILRT